MKKKFVPSQIYPLKEVLYHKYPEIFRQRHLAPTESSMHWGVECGDGWPPPSYQGQPERIHAGGNGCYDSARFNNFCETLVQQAKHD
jgi:hypothetical protein